MAIKEKLSDTELLERALIKDEDKPYDVPKNWVWTKIGNLFDVTSSKRVFKEEWKTEGVPFYRTREIAVLCEKAYVDNELFIEEEMYEEYKKKYGVPSENDLLVSGVGTIGKAYVVRKEDKFYFKDGNIIWFKNIGKINAKYIAYLYKSDFMINQIHDFSSGTTVDTYTIINAKKTIIPLPPLSEQQRIVDIIDSLFEKIDHAKELAQYALDSFENRKSAILHKAFTGELTAKWREENGVCFEKEWKEKIFNDVATVKSNLVDPLQYKNLPHIAPDNIEKRTGKLLDYNTIEQDGVTSGKHKFYSGQILYSKIRPYLSKVVIVDFNGLCSADMYPIETKLNTRYLWYYMLSDDFMMAASSAGSRSVLPKINQKELGQLTVVCPPIEEQGEIVRILDNLFEKEEKAKECCDVIEKIDLMKKTILAKAFRGELGTNNPEEESAIELLKEVLKKG